MAEKAESLAPAAGCWAEGGTTTSGRPPTIPTRHDLDRVAPNNPVILDRKDLHSCWVNTPGPAARNVTRDTPDPPGAAIGRDEAGEPDGMFYESAVQLARNAVDEPPESALEAMQRGLSAGAAMGLMGFHDCEGPRHSPPSSSWTRPASCLCAW